MTSTFSTGDLKNNVSKLKHWIRKLKYPHNDLDFKSLVLQGHPQVLLSVLHYALLDYSIEVATEVCKIDSLLSSANDKRFMEGVYRIMNNPPYNYNRIPISVTQFLSLNAFIERKVITTCEILQRIIARALFLSAKASRDSLTWSLPDKTTSSWKHMNLEDQPRFVPPVAEKPPKTVPKTASLVSTLEALTLVSNEIYINL